MYVDHTLAKEISMKILVTVTILSIAILQAKIISVPSEHAKIQSAINAAVHSDTVVVYPGIYYENINFNGKNIVVTSRFYETHDLNFISATVINGSQPNHPDTASCVLIVSGENSSAILQGFTITEGKGTRWIDEHGAGTYREGGGILVTLSSPTVRYNYIVKNEILNGNGVTSTGGGGIRIGDGGGIIENNVITLNKAMYGGGIVLNYCSGTIIRNNMILENSVRTYVSGKQGFGGGGLWLGSPKPGDPSANIIENNTIYGNVALDDPTVSFAGGRGGAMVVHSNIKAIIRNNIIWENHSSFPISSVAVLNADVTVEYNDITGGYTGTGNIDADPQFGDSAFVLVPSSPCVDAGDSNVVFDDPHNGFNPELGVDPSRGTTRNDMGAYGGPKAHHFFAFSRGSLFLPIDRFNFDNRLPGDSSSLNFRIVNFGSKSVRIDSIRYSTSTTFSVSMMYPKFIPVNASEIYALLWKPTYSILYIDTMMIYHNSSYTQNPMSVALRGNAVPTPRLVVDLTEHNFGSIDINTPSKDTTVFIYNDGTSTDSVLISVNATGVNPTSAVSVSPQIVTLLPGDSQSVTFTFHPKQIVKSFTGVYAPKLRFKSYRGEDTTTMEKSMRFRLTGVLSVENGAAAPERYALMQNYPNPFNPITTISYQLPKSEMVILKVYNILGTEIKTLTSEVKQSGYYSVLWRGDNAMGKPVTSGVYVYVIRTPSYTMVKKMLLLK